MSNSTPQYPPLDSIDSAEFGGRATEASALLKAMSHQGRLMVLCHLCSGEKSVSELQKLIAIPQATVSCHLARLRLENLVCFRKCGKACLYSIKDAKARKILAVVNNIYCNIRMNSAA